ncbi:hypothetical protein ADILRU_0068 [Leifsonia rubra CMS 76R]|nr:hypothetical protein ADILRU_0068 [Leifsonia rubra CMS 76R]
MALAGGNAQTLSARSTFAELGVIWLEGFRTKDRTVQTVQHCEASLNGAFNRAPGSLPLGELDNGLLRRTVRAIANSGQVAEARLCRALIRVVLAYSVVHGAASPQLINCDGFQLSTPRKKPRAIQLSELVNLRGRIVAHPRPGPSWAALNAEHLTLLVETKVEYARGVGFRLGKVKSDATARGIELAAFALVAFALAILRRQAAVLLRPVKSIPRVYLKLPCISGVFCRGTWTRTTNKRIRIEDSGNGRVSQCLGGI